MQSLGSLFNIGCYMQRTGRQSLLVNGGAGLVALAGYALLVAPFGVAGAVAATLLGQAVRLVWFVRLSQRSAPLAYGFGKVALLACGAALVAALAQLVPPLVAVLLGAPLLGTLALLAVALGLLPRLNLAVSCVSTPRA
jgi:O-antigen/teichoic acid export membrane protein